MGKTNAAQAQWEKINSFLEKISQVPLMFLALFEVASRNILQPVPNWLLILAQNGENSVYVESAGIERDLTGRIWLFKDSGTKLAAYFPVKEPTKPLDSKALAYRCLKTNSFTMWKGLDYKRACIAPVQYDAARDTILLAQGIDPGEAGLQLCMALAHKSALQRWPDEPMSWMAMLGWLVAGALPLDGYYVKGQEAQLTAFWTAKIKQKDKLVIMKVLEELRQAAGAILTPLWRCTVHEYK